jgi:hypothetical protein
MESVLDKLEILVKDKKKLANELYETDLIKKISNADYDSFLSMIKMMKDDEKNQRRLDWKSGYLYACLDVAEFLGNERSEAMPTEYEMQEIDEMSFQFINNTLPE